MFARVQKERQISTPHLAALIPIRMIDVIANSLDDCVPIERSKNEYQPERLWYISRHYL